MSRLAEEIPVSAEPDVVADEPGGPPARHEVTNFIVITAQSVLMRMGWIFKTESIVMPICLSALGGGPAMLGWLPVMMRFGLSVPPLLYTTRLKHTPRKKYSVAATTFGMAAAFGVLASLWLVGAARGEASSPWAPYFFLAVYGVFHCLTGMNQLGTHTLQGKLVRADRRGRLFAVGVIVGVPLSIAAAVLVMPSWLALPGGGFGWIFGLVALFFLASGLVALAAREEPDDFREDSTNAWQKFHAAWRVVTTEANCRRLAFVAVLASANFMLFPYYQALGRADLRERLGAIVLWLCVQNTSTALFGLIAGPLADRVGNRAALRLALGVLALAPATALALRLAPTEVAEGWFWFVFVPLGLTPVSLRFLINYTLEISAPEDHPRYVSAIGMCLALPVIVGSPIVGLTVSRFGTEPVLVAGMVALAAAAWYARRLVEPRHAAA